LDLAATATTQALQYHEAKMQLQKRTKPKTPQKMDVHYGEA
jgi:hypothetical protein